MRSASKSVLAAMIAASLAAAPASARVGVTSVADGEPLGQPPAQAERVLRVGIDVQASERVTTKANDRAHVVFLDGTALTVGPNSVLVIDKYVYDPDRKVGDMALSTTKGVFRFVGGSISKNSEVVVTTPTATIGIRGGIATIEVIEGGATKANFIYGDSLRVTNASGTQLATRNGSVITAPAGGPISPAAILPPGRMPGNEPFERTASAAPLAIAAQPLVQNVVNQNIAQQVAAQTVTTTTPNVAATTPATATTTTIDTALDQSGLATKNSRVPPNQMKIATRFDPKGPVQRGGADQDSQGAGPKKQPQRAGGPPPAQVPKLPPVVRPGAGPTIKPVIPVAVTKQPVVNTRK